MDGYEPDQMLVHGYRQVLRLARLPRNRSLYRFVRATREKGSRVLDTATVGAQKGIAVTETVVTRAVEAAPRPTREGLQTAVEKAVRAAPKLAGRPVEVVLMAAIAVATVVLAVALVNGMRTASAHFIQEVGDAANSALTQLDLDEQP